MEKWIWEYKLCYYDGKGAEYNVSGLIFAEDTMTSAIKKLEDYYGNTICELTMLKPIEEGEVFEFQLAMKGDLDYIITPK